MSWIHDEERAYINEQLRMEQKQWEERERIRDAAPDLLEALKRLERTVRIMPPDMDQPDSPLAQARAAISKAEGKRDE